jgi:hypothetical protein
MGNKWENIPPKYTDFYLFLLSPHSGRDCLKPLKTGGGRVFPRPPQLNLSDPFGIAALIMG